MLSYIIITDSDLRHLSISVSKRFSTTPSMDLSNAFKEIPDPAEKVDYEQAKHKEDRHELQSLLQKA